MGRRQDQAPRPETRAFAARQMARPNTYGSLNGVAIEEELIITRLVASRLFRLLRYRDPAFMDRFEDELTVEARAAADRLFEAAMLLFHRHRIDVVPCRKMLVRQDDRPSDFVLTRPGGESEIVDEARLLLLAGLSLDG